MSDEMKTPDAGKAIGGSGSAQSTANVATEASSNAAEEAIEYLKGDGYELIRFEMTCVRAPGVEVNATPRRGGGWYFAITTSEGVFAHEVLSGDVNTIIAFAVDLSARLASPEEVRRDH